MGARPLTDRVKEALFNILMGRVAGVNFLDVFAGSGAVGLEAFSRGASKVFFIEKHPPACRVIQENLEQTGLFDEQATLVLKMDATHGVDFLNKKQISFDIIFLGAPYDDPALEKTLNCIGQSGLLAEKGWLIAEHRKQHFLAEVYGRLKTFRSVRYGETELTFYENSHLPG